MPNDTGDYLKKRAQELGLGRADILAEVQAWLDHNYPGRAHAISLNAGVLKIVTPSASVAGDLRLRQGEIPGSAERISISLG